jgi:hypothetical protein
MSGLLSSGSRVQRFRVQGSGFKGSEVLGSRTPLFA